MLSPTFLPSPLAFGPLISGLFGNVLAAISIAWCTHSASRIFTTVRCLCVCECVNVCVCVCVCVCVSV